MAMNKIQFQHGMSLPEFLRGFGTEAACAQAVMAARWPNGFSCPKCGEEAHCVINVNSRPLFQCNGCRRQTSVTAGTLFAGTKLPLTTWFLAIYLISQAKTGLSALALKRQLGVSYRTAWLVNHKIMCAMSEREDAHQLTNVVQMDDAYLGGELSGGTAGRGSENKVPFVAAVSLNEMGHPVYLKLTMVAGFTRDAIKEWANLHLAPGRGHQRRLGPLRGSERCRLRPHADCRRRSHATRPARIRLGQHGPGQSQDDAGRCPPRLRLLQIRDPLPRCLRLPA